MFTRSLKLRQHRLKRRRCRDMPPAPLSPLMFVTWNERNALIVGMEQGKQGRGAGLFYCVTGSLRM